jgi:hypothetical protein
MAAIVAVISAKIHFLTLWGNLTMKRLFMVVVLIGLCGCEEPSGPTQNGANPAPPPPPPPSSSGAPAQNAASVAKPLWLNVGTSVEGRETLDETHKTPDAKLIESKVRSLPWQDGNVQCYVRLAPDDWAIDDSDILVVSGTLNSSGPEELASPQRVETLDGKKVRLRGSNFRSVDQIVAMLISYFQKDGQYKTMVEWKESKD